MRFICRDGHLDDPVQPVFKDAVGFFDFAQRKAMGDERRGVQLALLD